MNSTLKILNLRIFAIAVLVAVWAVQLHGQDAKTQMPIDLNTVMKLAGANNLRVAEMDARRELAIAEAKTAKEWFLPTISPGVLLVGYEGNAQATDGTFIEVNKNSFWGGAAITADWNLGDAVFSYLEAKQDIKTAEYATAAESNRVQLEAVKTYYELGAAQGKLTALNKIVKKAADITRQIEFQVEAGIRYKSDVLLAKANLNHIKIEQSNARWEILSTSNELLNILNIKDDVVLIVSDSILCSSAVVA